MAICVRGCANGDMRSLMTANGDMRSLLTANGDMRSRIRAPRDSLAPEPDAAMCLWIVLPSRSLAKVYSE